MINIAGELLSKEEIAEKVKRLAGEIESFFGSEDIVIICILKGASMFTMDLIREIKNDVILDFMIVSSYGMQTKSSGIVKIIKDVDVFVEGKNVLVVEDIIDTGLTLKYLKDYFERRGCKEFKICTLLDKAEKRTCDIVPDFVGFTIPNKFVVGYGIDCGEKYRNLPYIGYVEE
ncbi:MAG: hypoxanthine phosphoribosyltransferase [Peptostreptococcaceae bacterium]|nr:hypoxanthine phosphoribosyltransferase [Peptostreptococcaceae bacterium]